MSVESVKEYLSAWGVQDRVVEFEESSATVEEAAQDIGVEPARIAKTMAFQMDDSAILLVSAGDAKVWNAPFKARFHTKPKMVPADQLVDLVGHPMGGVCPFDRNDGVRCYLDESLKRFEQVWPAAGSENSAIGVTIPELEEFSRADGWVDVCKGWRED